MNPIDTYIYFKNRTIIPGACVICLFSCLAGLYGTLLFKYFKKDGNADLNEMNVPLNNENNNTPYTSISLKVSI